MSEQAKTSLICNSDSPKLFKISVDCAEEGLTIGCHSLDAYIPKFHDIVNVDFAVETVGASDGSATVSFGFDDIASEPDNLLNDEAIASFGTLTSAAGATVAGIPRIGTAATKVVVGASDAQLAYEIKTAALTALKFTAIITAIPTR